MGQHMGVDPAARPLRGAEQRETVGDQPVRRLLRVPAILDVVQGDIGGGPVEADHRARIALPLQRAADQAVPLQNRRLRRVEPVDVEQDVPFPVGVLPAARGIAQDRVEPGPARRRVVGPRLRRVLGQCEILRRTRLGDERPAPHPPHRQHVIHRIPRPPRASLPGKRAR
jgi:hypothetical protein